MGGGRAMAEGGLKPPEGAGKGGGGAAGDGREAGSGDWASIAAAVGQQAISMLVAGQPQAFVDFFYLACQREEGKECVALSGPGARALPALLLLLLLLRENSPPWLGRAPPPLPRAPPRGGPGARGMHAKGRLDLEVGLGCRLDPRGGGDPRGGEAGAGARGPGLQRGRPSPLPSGGGGGFSGPLFLEEVASISKGLGRPGVGRLPAGEGWKATWASQRRIRP